MENQTGNSLKDALFLLEKGDPVQAQKIISQLFENDLDSKELIYANRCCTYWIDSKKRLSEIDDHFELGERILEEWKNFKTFMSSEKFTFDQAFYAVQRGFFSTALENYTKHLDEKDSFQKAEAYRKAGLCYKKLGDFESAKSFLTEANNSYPNLPHILAELADSYSLCGEDRVSKVLFREAFFINPDDIELEFLDSELIRCLIQKTSEKGYTGKQLLEWIPVYGILFGVFNIKRELHTQDVIRLKKNIYAMENEFKDPSCNVEMLVPRLLYNYFWLIDHYVLTREDPQKINEIFLKIKVLDSSVYNLYRN